MTRCGHVQVDYARLSFPILLSVRRRDCQIRGRVAAATRLLIIVSTLLQFRAGGDEAAARGV